MLGSGRIEEEVQRPIEDQIRSIAEETLNKIDQTAISAEALLKRPAPSAGMALASYNSLTSNAGEKLAGISEAEHRSLSELAREPAIARLVVRVEDGPERTIFITRATPLADAQCASYLSPMGRLAALPVGHDGEVLTSTGVRNYEVVEKALIKPVKKAGEWDAIDTVFESLTAGPVTVRSLRTALRSIGIEVTDDDYLAQLIAGDPTAGNIVDGIRRSVIEKMELRERSVLDLYQDNIFRLPLDTQLAILGPPGAGKTTTLIKRLRQKCDIDYLEPEEVELVERSAAGAAGHKNSWLMFTPTELLKRYVVEALGREGVPASDYTVQTWEDQRVELGRNRLGVLRSGSATSGGLIKPRARNLLPEAILHQIDWFEDFQSWQAENFWMSLGSQAVVLSEAHDSRVRTLGQRIAAILPERRSQVGAGALLAFDQLRGELSALEHEIKTATEKTIRSSIAHHARFDRDFLDKLYDFAKSARDAIEPVEDADDVDADEEEEEEAVPRGNREEAIAIYIKAQKRRARSRVQRRSIGTKSRDGRILEWLGDRGLDETSLKEVGEAELQRQALRRFANPIREYVARVRLRYGQFRRERLAQGRWYAEAIPGPDLSPLEVDLVILATLRAGRLLLADRRVVSAVDEPRYMLLRNIRSLMRNQVVVDEATDFSPIQLACMAQLSDPAIGSFVACGDFNQRITSWGARTEADLRWVFSDIDIRRIEITYRHSRPLAELAARLSGLTGHHPEAAKLPQHLTNDGPRPVLAVGLDTPSLARWLKDRIVEIEHFTGRLPSVAVLVNEEAEVQPVADALDEVLLALNIRCEACLEGRSRGRDHNVRVFDVKHIKGLEFEAVFFVGVDMLAERHPDLFDKFLYVGATRAATYLGLVTAKPTVPPALAPLVGDFGQTFDERP
ncbi:ATP-binding domain-containing protein [Ancylobacter vacuolatus]|uniref:DNA 3'-5' helicase II n=1 Tax=Ancylobacter vacuolatus TaxID=223389 RepID=A0ABU0DP08_9HYPH|nr:ATP-binding domain-containing protein [Ancylobacter vacuolatus]MDQ0350157.1 hypothetical protein [Ancylobacter vacuolatus]